MTPSAVPALVLLLWALATLGWWAFAFLPLPSSPPPWLAAARAVCFGTVDDGLPSAAGWLLLIPAPLSLFAVIVALWGRELGPALRATARSLPGRVVAAVLALLLAAEVSWVATKIGTARAVARSVTDMAGPAEPLPGDYPRRTVSAPEIALVDQDGAPVSLRALRSRGPVIVTFIFGHCQTLCPLVATTLKAAVPEGGGATVLLVTLDPWRDTPRVLDGIARRWELPAHFRLLSARATDDVLAVVRAYDVPSSRHEATGEITHPPLVFLVDRDGRLAYTFNNPPASWVREALARIG